MNATHNTARQILGWFCEGSFPALFTDSVAVAKRWLEQGHKVCEVIRSTDIAPTADDARADRDAAFEAVRKRLCTLPRYSFWIGDHGGVKRIEDRSGNWIDVDVVHELFDPVAVDAAIAAQQGKGDAA